MGIAHAKKTNSVNCHRMAYSGHNWLMPIDLAFAHNTKECSSSAWTLLWYNNGID